MKNIISFFKKNYQTLINWDLFLTFGGWTLWHLYELFKKNRLDYVEVSFAVQTFVMIFFIVVRKNHKAVARKYFQQLIALIAFCSGVLLYDQPVAGGDTTLLVSKIVTFLANFLGIATLLNLGKSFGILIAYRELKTNWLYNVIRHPMYLTDILLRIGFVISHFNYFTLAICLASILIYAYRAILEERFLCEQAEYSAYMQRVRYRFIPYIW